MSAGRFVWRELICTNPSLSFYERLFGWTSAEVQMGPMTYAMLKHPGLGEDVGGSMPPQMEGVPNFWFVYLTVDDLDTAEAAVLHLGGKVLTPQMSAPGVGKWFVAQDPGGATFAAFVGENPGATPDRKPPVGTFCWSQLMTNNLDRVVPFYAGLCGYEPQAMGPATVFVKDGVQRATAMAFPPDMPMPDHWLNYVAVENVDQSAARAKELGATVAVPPTDMGDMGRFAVLADPSGAIFALWTQKG